MNLRLIVLGITLRQRFHRLCVSQKARAVVYLLVIGVHDPKRIQIVTLTLGLGTDALALLNCGEPERKIGRGRWSVRVVKQAERNTPLGDATFGVGL